jgi:hypothetical protein
VTEPDHVSTTRAAYDASAETYAQSAGTELSAAFEGPVDRALLAAFVELVAGTAGPVADLGLTALPFRDLSLGGAVFVQSLITAGLQVHTRAVREPAFGHESAPQAFILARSVAAGR